MIYILGGILLFLILFLPSIRIIGPTQVGLVTKRFSFGKLHQDNPVAFQGEAGYQADGEATYIRETGAAKGAEVEAIGMARAKAYEAQVRALGQEPTAMVNAITALADRGVKFVPEVLVSGSNGSGSLDGLAGTLMRWLGAAGGAQRGSNPPAVTSPYASSSPVAESPIYPMPPSGK